MNKAGPILLLLRLADGNGATLSKLKGTLEYIRSIMVDEGDNTLEDQICTAFHNRAPELECDISSAAYVLDPQFVNKSRNTDTSVMNSFWKVARTVLRIDDDVHWRRCRAKIVSELAVFRIMGSGGFLHEDYSTPNACEFWGVAGCHAPTLKQIAFCLTPLPCSSAEAERNWMEVKSNMTKKRNRIDRARVEKMVFVRRFTNLQRKLFQPDRQKNSDFSAWVKEMLIKASKDDNSEPDSTHSDAEEDVVVFNDYIEPGEQARINGREPDQPAIPLTQLKKDNAAKSWLFEKYYNMCFVDKNPESEGSDAPSLSDEEDWEHRVVRNVVWWRHKQGVCTGDGTIWCTRGSID